MALTFLRHAALPIEHQGRYNGWRDIPLDKRLFDLKKVEELKKRTFDTIYSSDLTRCLETVELLFDGRLKPYPTTALREVKFNEEIEGKSFEEIEKLASFRPSYLESNSSWHHYICAESENKFNTRLKAFLDTLPNDKNILICSHAGAITAMLTILNRPYIKLDYLEYYEL